MKKAENMRAAAVIGILLFFWSGDVTSQTRDRSTIQEKDTWRLEDLYDSDESWRKAKDQLAEAIPAISRYRGKLNASPESLLSCLSLSSTLDKEFSRLYSYAGMKSDLDTRVSRYIGMVQEMGQLGTEFNSIASFIEPGLVKMSRREIDRFIAEQPELEVYRFYLYDLLRRKAHKRSVEEEKIIAEAGRIAGGPSDIYSIFANAELPYPEVNLSDGTKAKLNQAGYTRHRASVRRPDRELVFREFWGAMNNFRQTLGVVLYSNLKRDVFYSKVRGYASSLHSSLDRNNIPVDVYHSLIDNVNANLDAFHRYLKIKKRMLGVDVLKYSDLYAPTVKGVDLDYTIEEAKDLVLESCKPMGESYTGVVKRAFSDRWIDVYPTEGKQSGAYSNGAAYDVHPYILLNYNGKYDDVSTLAHELGHTMHSYLSNTHQPYPLADYSIFVAEVASTFNEALLHDLMMEKIKDDDVRLSLLMEYLDGIKGTVFRQTQFAEFELRIHEIVERNESLTGDVLTDVYGSILKKYYGHDEGITLVEDHILVEWAYISHFYYNFYVYQYATSFTASTALAESVIGKRERAVENVLTFLSAGGSKYPIDLLKQVGADMTSSVPFNLTIDAMNRTMDEIEEILEARGL